MKVWDAIKEIHYDENKQFESGKYFLKRDYATGTIECFWIGVAGTTRFVDVLSEHIMKRDFQLIEEN